MPPIARDPSDTQETVMEDDDDATYTNLAGVAPQYDQAPYGQAQQHAQAPQSHQYDQAPQHAQAPEHQSPQYDHALRTMGQQDDDLSLVFSRGLLAYRVSRWAAAAKQLELAQPQSDGGHLYFRALACLPLPGEENGALAADLLRQFEKRYAGSGLSEIAGHLARQLSVSSK